MNRFSAKINSIKNQGSLRLIELLVDDIKFTSIVLDEDANTFSFKENDQVVILFKDTEVSIAKGDTNQFSLRNQITGKVNQVDKGELLAKITIDTKIGEVNSVITRASTERLNIKSGDELTALIKTNEIFISK